MKCARFVVVIVKPTKTLIFLGTFSNYEIYSFKGNYVFTNLWLLRYSETVFKEKAFMIIIQYHSNSEEWKNHNMDVTMCRSVFIALG